MSFEMLLIAMIGFAKLKKSKGNHIITLGAPKLITACQISRQFDKPQNSKLKNKKERAVRP